jgi:hypothetical protein
MEDHPKYRTNPEPDAEPAPEPDPEHWPTTAELVAQSHARRLGEPYPTPEMLLKNLPVMLRAVCDFLLSGQASPYDIALTLASLIDAVENVQRDPPAADRKPH